MLHLRDRLPLDTLATRLSASDPGLLRLNMALRGTAAVMLTTLAAMVVAHLLHAGVVDFAAGIVLSMMGPFLMREPTRAQRQRTLLVLTIPAFLATCAATLLHGRGLAGNAVFLLLVFGCFLLQARNPRGIALGLVAVVAMYIGLYLQLPAATLPIQLLSVVLAVPVTAFACFVLVPIRPAATLRRTVAAVQARTALVLRQARQPGGDPAALRRSVARLNEAALAADDQLVFLGPASRSTVRLRLVELELAVAHLIAALDDGPPGQHRRGLDLHERRLRRRRWTPRHLTPTLRTDRSGLAGALEDLAAAAASLGAEAAQAGAAAIIPPAATSLPPGPLAWRVATRVTVASTLAMAGGMALSHERWFWAVITTYVVFLGARTRGDTLVKGGQRLGGTLLGLVAGLVMATLIGGHPVLEVAGLLLAVFGMYYLFLVSYTAGIFCVTVLLGLLYSLMGASLEPLLVLRLEETVIGTVAAMLVAVLLLPSRTRDQVARSGQAVLASLAEVVRCSREAWGGTEGASPLDAMRKLDRQVADLRLALLPLTVGRTLLRRSPLERPVPALLECVHWARVLAVGSMGAERADGDGAVEEAIRIEARLAQLASATEPDRAIAPPPTANAASTTLGRLDKAVTVLAERLAIRRADAFALEG